jgi:hypothetical protein
VPLAVVGAIARARRRDRTHFLSAIVLFGHAVYLVRIGGDHFELRPLDFYWPPIAIAAVEGMLVIGARFEGWLQRMRHGRVLHVRRPAAALLLGLALLYGSAVQIAKARHTMSFETRRTSQFLFAKLEREDSPWLFALPLMPWLAGVYNDLQDYTLRRGVGTVWREHEVFWRDELVKWKPYGIVRDTDVLPKDAVTARGSIGVIGYYLASVELIDQKGLTDRSVARTGTPRPNEARYMAHDRYATPEYLISRGLNFYPEPAATSLRDALNAWPFALKLRDDLWMPFSSRLPAWVETAFRGQEVWRWAVAAEVGCFHAGAESGWSLDGPAFAAGARGDVPRTRTIQWPERCSNAAGLISSDAQGGGLGQGTARSPLFRIPAGASIEARLFGVRSTDVGLRVIDAEENVIAELHPGETAAAMIEHVDLGPFEGREARVELYDRSEDAWVGALGIVLLRPERIGDG